MATPKTIRKTYEFSVGDGTLPDVGTFQEWISDLQILEAKYGKDARLELNVYDEEAEFTISWKHDESKADADQREVEELKIKEFRKKMDLERAKKIAAEHGWFFDTKEQ